jgi:hypothetical protein
MPDAPFAETLLRRNTVALRERIQGKVKNPALLSATARTLADSYVCLIPTRMTSPFRRSMTTAVMAMT